MMGGERVKSLPAFDFKGVKLFIAIPSRGSCTTDFAMSLAASNAALSLLGVDVHTHECRMSCFVDMNRNTLVAQFLKTDCTHFLFVEDDLSWNAEVIPKMLAQDVEFLAGAGPKKVDSGEEYCCQINVHADETPITKNGMISASRVGAGFMLLKRSVLERMIKEYPQLRCRAIEKDYGYSLFQTEYTPFQFKGEDYLFCDRWTAIGGEIWLFPDIDFVHTGAKRYLGNYHKFLSQRPQVEAESEAEGLKYSLIIVTYKAEEALSRCLTSLIDHAPQSAEIILVDNSRLEFSEGLVKALDKRFVTVIIHQDGVNKDKGFSEACNVGARLAQGRNLVFINPDTVVYPGWAEGLSGHLKEGVGAVGPLSNFVCGMQNTSVYEHSRHEEYADWKLVAEKIQSSKLHIGQETKLLIGFFLLVPRSVWDIVGEFDPAFVLGCDDLDYSLRLQQNGYKLLIAPDVFVYHEGHASFREEGDPALEMNQASEAHLREKLKAMYGDEIPSSEELWGCAIFNTDPLLAELLK
jgi:GT2 family glycosyltransferase